MQERRFFGTDGIRGRVGQPPITVDFILRVGFALGRVIHRQGGGRVVVGKDTRLSGYMFESALEAGLAAAGVDVYLLGPMPTPGIAYLTRTFHAHAGVVISASHNPYYDNGVKFFSSEGEKLPDAIELEIEAELAQLTGPMLSQNWGRARRIDDAAGRYIEYCKASVGGLQLKGMKLVLDCAHGATYHIAPSVFSELGAKVISIGVEPNGLNINEGVGATSPEALQAKVLTEGADLGLAFDGDGDRLIVVDQEGVLVDGDELLYVLAKDYHERACLQGGVVGTVMSNLGLEQALQRESIPFVRAKVGDRYVVEEMKRRQWQLGGESSGHLVCADVALTGDGIVSALKILSAMQRQGCAMSELTCELTKLPQKMINVPMQQPWTEQMKEKLQEDVRSIEKRLAQRGRVLLRPSGTEPLVRVMVEGEDRGLIAECAETLAEAVRACGQR